MTGITEGHLRFGIANQGPGGMLKRLKTITLIINAKAIVIAGLAVLSTFLCIVAIRRQSVLTTFT
jgi:hypothetical protein